MSNIPKRHLFKNYSHFIANTPKEIKALEYFKTFSKNKDCISILVGPHGTGKTLLSCCVMYDYYAMNIFRKKSVRCYYNTITNILLELSDITTRKEKLDNYIKYDYLVIDEFGRENSSDYSQSIIVDIIYHRYENYRKTVIISNYTQELMEKNAIYRAIVDRVDSVLVLNGHNRRLKN